MGTNGFSGKSVNEEFRALMKKQVNKNFKYLMIALPLVFVFVAVVSAVVCKINDTNIGVSVAADVIALIIILVIFIVNIIKYFKNLGKLKTGSIDGTVTKLDMTAADLNSTRKRAYYKIVIGTEDGKKITVKNDKAAPFYRHLKKGDRVRYHPGFVFPIELYDKSEVNVCVFCGKENDASVTECRVCKNPMLI